MEIRVLVNGFKGKMGQEALKMVEKSEVLALVAKTEKEDDLHAAIRDNAADVVVDFTVAGAGFENAKKILDAGARPVIGTTGISPAEISALREMCTEKQLGAIIAPNFSIGAVLMMKFAKESGKYFSDVEIIEMHHAGKVDAPSGTAIKTSEMIAHQLSKSDPESVAASEQNESSVKRGIPHHGIAIHSIRLPGLVAHQTVLFGGQGETLTIRHDAIDRACFMPGVELACRRVMDLRELVYGLEHIV